MQSKYDYLAESAQPADSSASSEEAPLDYGQRLSRPDHVQQVCNLLNVSAEPRSLDEASVTIRVLADQVYRLYTWQAEGERLWQQAGQGAVVRQPPAGPPVQNRDPWADAFPAELLGTSLHGKQVTVVAIIHGQQRYFTPEACLVVSGLSKELVGKKVGAL
jgi:hypothetical protein